MPITVQDYYALLPLEQVKRVGKIQYDSHDGLLESLIVAAFQFAERMCNTDFVRKTLVRTVTGTTDGRTHYRLRGSNLNITQVLRVSGNSSVILTDYVAIESGRIFSLINLGEIELQFPFFVTTRSSGYLYEITYETGYTDPLPISDVVQAVMQIVLHWFRFPEATAETSIRNVPLSATAILNQYIDYTAR